MAENEIEVAAEMGLPFTAKLSVRFKRRWTDRASKFLDDVSTGSGLDLPEIEDRMEQNERLEDLLLEGLAKAGRVTDPEYREALARVVVVAFEDAARVDEVEQLAGQLMMLDGFTLRVLRESYRRHDGQSVAFAGFAISTYRVGKALPADPAIIEAALSRLEGLGLVNGTLTMKEVNDNLLGTSPRGGDRWTTTAWGLRAINLCYRQLDQTGSETPER